MRGFQKTIIAAALTFAVLSAKADVYAAPEIMPDGGIFDAEYYAENNPDVVAAFGTDPAFLYQHYKMCGQFEFRLPYDPEADLLSEITIDEMTVRGFYGNSVFIGDSIMNGFRRFSANRAALTHDAQFLSSGSYSAVHALNPEDALHPLFRGESRPVWESIPMMDVDEVFIMFGTNEIGIFKTEDVAMHIELLGNKILETSPQAKIHLISMTPIYRGVTKLNNAKVDALNVLLQEIAERRNWGYVNIHDPLCDEKGRLQEKYCSDEYVHQTMRAYSEVWSSVLDEYAQDLLKERVLRQIAPEEEDAENEEDTEATGVAMPVAAPVH